MLFMMSFSLSIGVGVMLIFHTVLIFNNWTTLEGGVLMENNIFRDQTYAHCWKSTFGESKCLWFIPISSVDPSLGLDYKANVPVGGVLPNTQ